MSKQLFGYDTAAEHVTPQYDLGELLIDEAGNHFRYMKAHAALTANLLYSYDLDTWNTAAGINTTLAASGEVHPGCLPPIAITSAYFFWAFVGPGKATVTAESGKALAAQAKIFTSATAGYVDDDSSGEILIPGAIIYDAITSGGTGTAKFSTEIYVSN